MFSLKLHVSSEKTIVAACDSDILGRAFEENEKVLDVDKEFFGGEKVPSDRVEEIADSIRTAHTSNIVGNRITAELVKVGALKAGAVKEIRGIKYAMVFKID